MSITKEQKEKWLELRAEFEKAYSLFRYLGYGKTTQELAYELKDKLESYFRQSDKYKINVEISKSILGYYVDHEFWCKDGSYGIRCFTPVVNELSPHSDIEQDFYCYTKGDDGWEDMDNIEMLMKA